MRKNTLYVFFQLFQTDKTKPTPRNNKSVGKKGAAVYGKISPENMEMRPHNAVVTTAGHCE